MAPNICSFAVQGFHWACHICQSYFCTVGLKSHISNAMVVDSGGFTEGADATSGDAEAAMSSEEEEDEQEEEMVTDDTPAVQKVYIHTGITLLQTHRFSSFGCSTVGSSPNI